MATFLGLLALLHFLEPEFNSGHLISEYQLGRHGWMMSLAFCSFGIGAMLLAQGLPPHASTRSGRLGLRGLWLIGVALFTAGLFPPIPTRPVVTYVHGVSGLVVIIASPIVFLLASWSLVRESAWSGISRHLQWATVLAWVGLLSFLGSTVLFAWRAAGDPALGLAPAVSISNRLMITTYCLWFAVAAWGPARAEHPEALALRRAPGSDAGPALGVAGRASVRAALVGQAILEAFRIRPAARHPVTKGQRHLPTPSQAPGTPP